jgi:hypothetical protein
MRNEACLPASGADDGCHRRGPGKLGKMGPVPVGGGYYAQKMRERKEQVTMEGIEQAIEAFKASCSSQQVVCRRIEYEQKDPFTAMIAEARYNDLTIFGCAAFSITALFPTRTRRSSNW